MYVCVYTLYECMCEYIYIYIYILVVIKLVVIKLTFSYLSLFTEKVRENEVSNCLMTEITYQINL